MNGLVSTNNLIGEFQSTWNFRMTFLIFFLILDYSLKITFFFCVNIRKRERRTKLITKQANGPITHTLWVWASGALRMQVKNGCCFLHQKVVSCIHFWLLDSPIRNVKLHSRLIEPLHSGRYRKQFLGCRKQ